MKKRQIAYVEPAEYFPKEIRKKYKLGEYAKKEEVSNQDKKRKKQ